MIKIQRWLWVLILPCCFSAVPLFAQIDPTNRDLIQIGASQSIEGAAPFNSGYLFYYRNQPDFLNNSNLTLRLALAPVYIDSELGIKHALGENTDVGIGLAGGGFNDSYYEVEEGKYVTEQSFMGAGGTFSSSVYHLFNPTQRLPLSGILHGEIRGSDYMRNNDTDPAFTIPNHVTSLNVRTGFRLGGAEPVLFPELALEFSGWYEGQFRLNPQTYGFAADPYELNSQSQLFWGRMQFAYTLTNSMQNFLINITGGGSQNSDRFSAYRLGGDLPFSSEFPLVIPGYYNQELSAAKFVDFNGNYHIPIDPGKRFTLNAVASAAYVDYLQGLGQPGRWNTGVGGGFGYNSRSGAWKMLVDYGYGFEAIRTHGRGAQSIGLLMQIDLERFHHDDEGGNFFSRGFNSIRNSFD